MKRSFSKILPSIMGLLDIVGSYIYIYVELYRDIHGYIGIHRDIEGVIGVSGFRFCDSRWGLRIWIGFLHASG